MNGNKLSLLALGILSLALASPAGAGEGGPTPKLPAKPPKQVLPDLVAVSGKVTYQYVGQQTGKFFIKVGVRNPSQRLAGPFEISVKYGKKWTNGNVSYDTVSISAPGLGAGKAKVFDAEDTIGYPPGINGAKVHVVKEAFIKEVFVDSAGSVTESNELNNKLPRRK